MIRPLSEDDFDAVVIAFQEAFSDYVVPMKPSAEQLREMFRRRGWVPALSVAEFDGRITGFTINALDGSRGYDTGTGVIPTARRSGLGRRLMEESMRLLRDAGATSYVLEVIEQNERAVRLYLDAGFREVRRLQCWTYNLTFNPPPGATPATRGPDWPLFESWWDAQPSWQNSSASIRRTGDRFLILGDDRGYAIVFPSNGDVAQLAVRPGSRGEGVGRALLAAAATAAGKPLRIMNVEDRFEGFLAGSGATKLVRQIEMAIEL